MPSKIVSIIAWFIWMKLFSIIAWWDHVILTPEERRIIVLRRGTWVALNVEIPRGGQIRPSSHEGERLLWKNAQKKEKKNITSEIIKRIIPQRNPFITWSVCKPWNVLSRETSRHHWNKVQIKVKHLIRIRLKEVVINHSERPETNERTVNEAKIGHGLISIKWKWWLLFVSIK